MERCVNPVSGLQSIPAGVRLRLHITFQGWQAAIPTNALPIGIPRTINFLPNDWQSGFTGSEYFRDFRSGPEYERTATSDTQLSRTGVPDVHSTQNQEARHLMLDSDYFIETKDGCEKGVRSCKCPFDAMIERSAMESTASCAERLQ